MQRQDERFTETCVVIDKLERHEFGGFLVAKMVPIWGMEARAHGLISDMYRHEAEVDTWTRGQDWTGVFTHQTTPTEVDSDLN